jgi:hypothetical protein
VTFSRTPTSSVVTPFTAGATAPTSTTIARFTPFTPSFNGTIASITIAMTTGYTGNMKCSMFASSGGNPAAVLGSATTISNPVTGVNTFTFGTPITVADGTQYFLGFMTDAATGTYTTTGANSGFTQSSTSYAAFPTASPTVAAGVCPIVTATVVATDNNSMVNEAQQDATATYVYDSTVGHADFYGIASIGATPATVIATTARAYLQKSDAGTRTAAIQVKSGATTVASPTLTLTTSGWQWAWRMDTVDPATGAAWTPTAVSNAQIGPKVIA